MKNCAVIDIGSNTMRLCAYQYEGNNIQTLLSKKSMAGLASYVKKGNLTEEGTAAAINTLNSFKDLLNNLNIEDYHAFATASLRNIENTDDVLREIQAKTGIKIDVLSGREEGILSLRGATESVGVKDGLLIDLGGGSTEIVSFKDKHPGLVYSLGAGSLTLYKKFVNDFLPDKKECAQIAQYFDGLIESESVKISESEVICGVGGTFRAIAKLIDHVKGRPEGSFAFTDSELDELYKMLKKNDRPAKDLLLKITPDRLHTVIPGIIAVRVIIDKASCNKVLVSRTGVREGYMFAKILNLN